MYDYPVLNKVLGWPVPKLSKVDDTFIMSSLFNPDIATPKGCSKGAHSLEAWGLRMSYEKGEVDSFSEYTLPMLEYCIRDVEITTKLYRKMQAIRDKHDWELSLKIEYTMASLQAEQERQGVVLDEEKAYDLVEVLCEEIAEIDDLILRNVPAKPKPEGMPIETPFKLDGDYYDRVIKWYGDELWKA
jgi:DNA polymerase I-like protein with 3'-5' exonuclease and polymerase domains